MVVRHPEFVALVESGKDCPEEKREAAEHAHRAHASRCPVARSIGGCVAISTELQFE